MKLVQTIKFSFFFFLIAGAVSARLAPQQVNRLLAKFEPGRDHTNGHYTLVAGGVEGGDILRVTDGSRELKVRLCGIDAPEKSQTLGIESQDHLRQLIAKGTGRVTLIATDIDVHGQTVAEVFIPTGSGEEEINLNAQMVADGMAYVYPKYVGSCPNGGRMQTAEGEAIRQVLGVWADPNAQKPWDYRRRS